MSNLAKIVCVLGMHRSGTSCLTGSLQKAGLLLGKYHSWNRYNQKGNRENQDIVDFHEALLAANRASWDRPPAKLGYGEEDVERARQLIAAYSGSGAWGFKDPRTLLALPLWREAAPDMTYVGIFRHPLAVAESVSRRSGGRISIEQSIALWGHYNRILYDAWKQDRFPMLCFDWNEQEFHDNLDRLIERLGLQGDAGAGSFYSQELLHYETRRWDGVPWRLRRLYKKLSSASQELRGSSAAQRKRT